MNTINDILLNDNLNDKINEQSKYNTRKKKVKYIFEKEDSDDDYEEVKN